MAIFLGLVDDLERVCFGVLTIVGADGSSIVSGSLGVSSFFVVVDASDTSTHGFSSARDNGESGILGDKVGDFQIFENFGSLIS